MTTYNEIRERIVSIPVQKPTGYKTHKMRRSDGLYQSCREDVYGEPITSISKAIWQGTFTLQQKLDLTEALASKLKV